MGTDPFLSLPEVAVNELTRLADGDWRDPWGDRLILRSTQNRYKGRRGYRIRCVVWHITEGSLDSTLSWFSNPNSDASANDVIARDGRIFNVVPGEDAPWTNGRLDNPNLGYAIPRESSQQGVNPNFWSYTLECVGSSSWGMGGSLTPVQIAALIGRTAQACMEYHLTADREHILPHSAFDSVSRSGCPGFSPAEWRVWTAAVSVLTYRWRGW